MKFVSSNSSAANVERLKGYMFWFPTLGWSSRISRAQELMDFANVLLLMKYASYTCWRLDVSRAASYEITLVCLSVCPSVRPSVHPSLSFLKIGSLVFSDIVRDDSWPWYLVTDEARFLKKKKIWRPKFGPNGSKLGPKLGFCH